MQTFTELGLPAPLLNALSDLNFLHPTPIQQQSIVPLLQGKDLLGAAQTGTGKTAAFSLPILARLLPLANTSSSPAKHPIRFLTLTPTRELAIQVFDSIKTFSKYTALKSACIFGGVAFEPQKECLLKGVDILVATPGRLLDFIGQGLHLHSVQALVLDEADRMLDMGFLPDVLRILNALPQARQSVLFSATFSKEIKQLATRLLNQPVIIEITPEEKINKNIEHVLYAIDHNNKKKLLIHLLENEFLGQTLVFVKTKQGATELNRHLNAQGIVSDVIHGDRTQNERLAVFQSFKDAQIRILVATDVAARGLDVDDLPCVINFELPTNAQDYVHRIGRTGRAGKKGVALSLFCAEEEPFLKEIERLIQQPILQKPSPFSGSKTHSKSMVAQDGFRFDLPYQPQNKTKNPAPGTAQTSRQEKPLAVLLGGRGR